MRFELSDDQALLRSTTRDFLAAEFALERTRRLIEDGARGHDQAEWGRLAEMGYLGLVTPVEAGGQGLGAIELAIVQEEMGRICMPGPYLDAVLAGAVLAAAGGQQALLGDLQAGKKLVTIAREDAPFAGSPGPAARFEGNRVRGSKYFVPFAAAADALLVTTADGICLASGPFESTPLPTIDPAQRFAAVKLEHTATRVGPLTLLERVGQLASVGAAAMLLGIMSKLLDTTLEYVRTRKAFGRPIGAFQALQHRLADMLLRIESTRSAVYRAAWSVDAGDAETVLAYAGDASRHVCGEAIQMHGGIGFTWELDVHLYFKRAKTLEQHYGATETQVERALAAAGF